MRFLELGVTGYEESLEMQEDLLQEISDGLCEETVLLLEHPHVFTLGRAGKDSNLISTMDWMGNPVEMIRTSRGGDITYHGPGQLVAYPLLNLRSRRKDVHLYLRNLESCLLETAASLGVEAFRREGMTGVWTSDGKLASIGIGVRNWITMHGVALNVSTDLRYFELINPCGLPDCPVTSLSRLLGRELPVTEVMPVFRNCFERTFLLKEDQS